MGVANGTDALQLALRGTGVLPGQAVMTSAHTAVATVAAIEAAGAIPIFADIDPEWMVLGPNQVQDAVQQYQKSAMGRKVSLRALVVVHLYGQPADMPGILEICRQNKLICIEDCAQSAGASWNGKMTGVWGDASSFSFYPTKNLGAFGDAGAVVSRDPKILRRVRMLREYGWSQRNMSRMPGINSRLDELQAAFLRILLKDLAANNERRRKVAEAYRDSIRHKGMELPRERGTGTCVYHQYVIRSKVRNRLKCYLKDNGVGTNIHYPYPIHLQPAYRGRIWMPPGGLPATERAAREVLSLPMHPYLSREELSRVVELLNRWSPREV